LPETVDTGQPDKKKEPRPAPAVVDITVQGVMTGEEQRATGAVVKAEPPQAIKAPETAEVAQAAAVIKPAVPLPSITPTPAQPPPAPLLATGDPYAELGAKLAEKVPPGGRPVRIGIGSFLSGETSLMAAYSAEVRQEMQRVLMTSGRFQIVSRERLAALMLEGRFLGTRIFEAGSEVTNTPLEEVDAVLRGRYVYYKNEVRITAELVWLARGEIARVEVVSPAKSVLEKLWPGKDVNDLNTQIRLAEVMTPQNEVGSLGNIKDVEQRVGRVAHDFEVRLVTADARQDYAEGEVSRYKFCSTKGCHVAIFCHQVDGTSAILFPNRWSKDTWVPAGQVIDIPGAGKGGFEIVISSPFGADVVQAVACTAPTALHRLVSEVLSKASPDQSFGVITRGVFTSNMAEGLAEPSSQEGPVRWAETRLVICTYPKLAEWSR
jgi:hypothetical protein